MLHVLNGGEIPTGWNETTIILIPKVKDLKRVSEFRPISLCNVIYKLISEALANRLKLLLLEIISPTQSTFVPGHMRLHTLCRKGKGEGKEWWRLNLI